MTVFMSGNREGVRARILGTGLIALDVVQGLDANCGPSMYAGGTCGNVLAALAFLGWEACPIARLNGDAAGEFVRDDLNRWKVRMDFARLAPQTSTPVILQRLRLDAAGRVVHRFSSKCPSCGGWLPQYQPVPRYAIRTILEELTSFDVVFVDRLSAGAVALAEEAYLRDAVIYFEPSANGSPALFHRMLSVTHVLKYSSENVHYFGEYLRPRHPSVPLEIETFGAKGLRYRGTMFGRRGEAWRQLPPPLLTELRDPAGAGDWLTVGILHTLAQAGLAGFESLPRDIVEEGLQAGQRFAAWTCGFEGPRGGMYNRSAKVALEEIQTILDQGHLSDASWTPSCGPVYNPFAEICGVCS